MVTDYSTYTSSPAPTTFADRWGASVLCGICGLLCAFTVSFVGLMPVGEIVLLILFPWVLTRMYSMRGWPTRIQQLGWHKLLALLLALMIVGYVMSDVYRGTPSDNLIRGWARVGFLAIDLLVIGYLIAGSWTRLFIFVLFLHVGGTLNAVINGPLGGDWWQFGYGYTLTALVLFFCGGRSIPIQIAAAVALAALNFFMGARSLGGICLLVASLFGLRYARGIFRPAAIITSITAVVALIYAANTVILANQNHKGSNLERQSMVEMAGETFLASPFIGQGSWFTATQMISRLEELRKANDPFFRGYTAEEARQLSIHSQLLVALAEGGILGGAFFLGLGALLIKTLRRLTVEAVPHRTFVLLIVILGLWNLLMSPFSGVARVEIVLCVCACLAAILQFQGELAEDFRE